MSDFNMILLLHKNHKPTPNITGLENLVKGYFVHKDFVQDLHENAETERDWNKRII